MRRIALILVCLIPLVAHSEDRGLIEDGSFWNALTYPKKIGFVQGYANGYLSGQAHLKTAFDLDGAKSYNHSIADHDKPVDVRLKRSLPVWTNAIATFAIAASMWSTA
jgi:hypothetical protein